MQRMWKVAERAKHVDTPRKNIVKMAKSGLSRGKERQVVSQRTRKRRGPKRLEWMFRVSLWMEKMLYKEAWKE